MKKILIIQTAYIGDVILATSLIESLTESDADIRIDMVVRKGNETLLTNHPKLNSVFVWDKSKKYKSLFQTARKVREQQYDLVINLQRFGSSGFLTWRSRAKEKSGFSQNPFSFCYSHKVKHIIGNGKHEIERNFELLPAGYGKKLALPKLYPTPASHEKLKILNLPAKYVTMAPASVWFTKQLPLDKWTELINKLDSSYTIYLLGAPSDLNLLESIQLKSPEKNTIILAGKIGLLDAALLMKNAHMNYVNDSGPLHLASAINAPVTAYFCSTVPEFGFGPLSEKSRIVQIEEKLSCRPCGLHGFRECPEDHYKCGNNISILP